MWEYYTPTPLTGEWLKDRDSWRKVKTRFVTDCIILLSLRDLLRTSVLARGSCPDDYCSGTLTNTAMTHTPPNDQTIVDETTTDQSKTQPISLVVWYDCDLWPTPDALEGFSGVLKLDLHTSKRRPVSPVHPQWAIIFRLKKTAPQLAGLLAISVEQLYCAMAYQKVGVNITDLLLSHQMRKRLYRSVKRPRKVLRPLASVSWQQQRSSGSCHATTCLKKLRSAARASVCRRRGTEKEFCDQGPGFHLPYWQIPMKTWKPCCVRRGYFITV